MSFEIEGGDGSRLMLRGRFDASREEYAREILEQVESSCVLDFQEVDYISSAGLGLIVALQLRISKQGHQVVLANVSEQIQKLLRLAGLESMFPIR